MEITVDQMYQIENNGHDMGFLKKFMMENAGAVAVRRLIEKIGNVDSKNILIFVGMGNNGGDGQVMARHLAGHNANVVVVLLGTPDKIKTEESSWNWSLLEKMKKSVKLYKFGNEYPKQDLVIGFLLAGQLDKVDFGGNVAKPDIIIDAILGTGVQG